MKKVFTLLMAALFVAASSLSAQIPAAPAAKKEVKKEMKKADKDMKKAGKDMKKADKDMKKATKDVKNVTPPPPPPAKVAPGQHLKKDGTPDKRFKENKEGAAPKHLKKDGTPDKRFKENKEPKK